VAQREPLERISLERGTPVVPSRICRAVHYRALLGYAAQPDRGCVECRVIHPSWRVWQVRQSAFEGDADNVYGKEIAAVLQASRTPHFSRKVRGYRDAGKDCECAIKTKLGPSRRSLWRRLYDGRCGFCSRWVKYWEKTLTRVASQLPRWRSLGRREVNAARKTATDIRLLTRMTADFRATFICM